MKKASNHRYTLWMDEEDALIDEKAFSPVASWLTSSLFWLVAQWKDSM